MIQPDFKIVFFFRLEVGSICSCQCFQELYLETGHGNVHFSQHFSAPLLFSPHKGAGVFEISLIILKKKPKWLAAKPTKIGRKEGISLELRAMYGQRRHASKHNCLGYLTRRSSCNVYRAHSPVMCYF